MPRLDETRRKVEDGVRLSREEGVALLRDADLLELGALADTVRWRKHPEAVVTYIIDRNINYTNVCNAQCAFCAFYRDLPSKEGYLLSKPQLAQKIEETIALGGRQILLQGGLHPDLGIEYYEELFRWMKASYPIWIHGLSPAEVQHIVRVSKLSLEETLRRLMAAGLDSIPGGGAEILSDRVRKIIGIAKGSTSEWLEVMETAHRLGMRTTATMMFGHKETLADRVEHLDRLRDLQDDAIRNAGSAAAGFTAFICWTFQPDHTAMSDISPAGSFEYLKTQAIVGRKCYGKTPTAHLQDPWLMSYDLFPMDTLAFKRRFIREAIDREYLILFEHDPRVSAGYIRENAKGQRFVEQVL